MSFACLFSLKLAWKRKVLANHLVHLHLLFPFVPLLCLCNVYILAFLRCLCGFRAFPLSISRAKKGEKKEKRKIAISIYYVATPTRKLTNTSARRTNGRCFVLSAGLSCPAHSLPFASQRRASLPFLSSQPSQPLHSPASFPGSKYLMSF